MKDSMTSRQCAIICFFMPQVFKIALLPSLLYEQSGRDAWITAAILMLIDFLQLAFVMGIDSLGGMKRLREKYGNIAYFAFAVPIVIVEVFQGSILITDVANYIKATMFYYVTDLQIVVVFIIAVIFISVRGAKGFGRLSEMFCWITPLILIAGLLGSKVDITPHMILPVMGNGVSPVLDGIDRYLFWTLDFAPFLFLSIDTSRAPKVGKKSIFISAVCSVIFMIGFFILLIMNYGGGTAFISIALSAISNFNVFNSKIGNLDWIFTFQWVCVAAITIGLKLFSAGKVLEKCKVKRQAGVIVSGVILLALYLIFFYNVELAVDFSTGAVKYVVFAVQLGAPLVIFILLLILKIKERRKARAASPVKETGAAEVQ